MRMREQDPEIDELCELLAGLELIQRTAEFADRSDAMDSLETINRIAGDLVVLIRSLDETTIFNLDKIPRKEDSGD